MIRIFKKQRWLIEKKTFEFFRQIFIQFPTELKFLIEGLNKGLYKSYSINHALKGNHYSIGFDPSQSDKSMIRGMHFALENILVIQNGIEYKLNISIHDGLWIGFEIEKNVVEFKNYKIDLSKYKKNESIFAPDINIEILVKGLSSNMLELENLGEIEINKEYYYQIKDLEDGNYIVIDKQGKVFGLIHDPYKIELINKSVIDFVEDVNSGRFNFEEYLIEKNGYA